MAIVKHRCAITLLVLSGFMATPEVVAGQDITMSTRTRCTILGRMHSNYIVYAGRSMKGQFKGPWADFIKTATVSHGGISATLSNPVSNWANSTIDVVFRVDANTDWDYSPDRSVDIFVTPTLQPSYTKYARPGFTIIPPPALTGSSVPRADYYQTVDVTLTGTNLNGANLASATARVDATHPVAGYAGEAVQISNGATIPAAVVGTPTKTQAVVRLSLPQKLTALSVDIKLTASNADACTPFGAGPGADPPPVLSRRVTMAVPTLPAPPYVQSIAVLNAKVGRDAEFTITLNKPVGRPIAVLLVWWKMAPSAVFSAVPGDVGYDPNSFSRIEFGAGESVKRFKLRVLSLPPGGVNVGTAYLQTWSGDRTKNVAPGFFQKDFTITQ